jgi:hypothetical protein
MSEFPHPMPGSRVSGPIEASFNLLRMVSRAGLVALVIVVGLTGYASGPVPVTSAAEAAAPNDQQITSSLHKYVVHLAQSNTIVQADAAPSDLSVRSQAHQHDELAAVLDKLVSSGEAGQVTFDGTTETFIVELSEIAATQLRGSPLVASLAPVQSAAPTGLAPAAVVASQGVSSVDFVQVYSPFMWGHASIGGLSVQLALLDSSGTVTIGVPSQNSLTPPNNYVAIDRTQLYYETIFVDPNNPSHPPVMILPGELVHVITSGTDPSTNQQITEDKLITVDDVQAWTSDQNDIVSGHTSLASAPVVITSGGLNISNYLTPGSSVTYSEQTADGNGNFSASSFRTSSNATYSRVDLTQGSTGFVRVQHPDGSEVYTVHGQYVLPLEH